MNADKYVLSPIDGYVSNIQTINIDDVLFYEITLNFSWYSDRNLFAPMKGDVFIKEEAKDRCIISVGTKGNTFNNEGESVLAPSKRSIEVSHYRDHFLSKLNPFSSYFISIYENECWIPATNYGFMLYGNQVKVLIHANNELVVSTKQNVIGGESILAIFVK